MSSATNTEMPSSSGSAGRVQLNYRNTVARALADEMELDPRVVFLGEDVGEAGGAFKATVGLKERFGDRVRDTPISEQAIVGAAIGASVMGLRPVAEIMFSDFAGVCFDQIVNSLAKYRYTTGGQARPAVTIRMANGAGTGFGPQHSQSAENWFVSMPGLKIVVPGTVEDLYGLLRSSIRDDDPVLVFEHKALFSLKGSLPAFPDDAALVPLGRAKVARAGCDVTVVAAQQMLHRSLEAADQLAARGISAEVIDPRTLVPFDMAAILESLDRTARLAVVQEGPPDGGWGASLVSRVVTQHMERLDAPPALLTSDPVPTPYSKDLELASLPTADEVAAEVERLVSY